MLIQKADAQTFTRGGASQIYWNWRPDIADSCYEFTFVNYISATSSSSSFCPYINMFYWNDCDYGKNYIDVAPNGLAIVPPLHDTLYRVTSYTGIVDTFCGFNAPYNAGTAINTVQTTSPHRKELIYRGLVYLPEKCKNWHFLIGHYDYLCVSFSDRILNCFNGSDISPYTNLKSNYDSLFYDMYRNRLNKVALAYGIYSCSMNNLDFPDNSSIRFTSQPMYYFRTDKPVEYNPGPYDPDHDSIEITISDTLKSTHVGISGPGYIGEFFMKTDSAGVPNADVFTENHYFAPLPGQIGTNPFRFNAENNPFDTDSTFHLADSTGKTTFTAKSEMEPLLYYKAKKYRNGKFVNETYFLNQFTLMDDTRPVSYMKIDTANMHGAILNTQGTMMGCAGYPIDFDAYIKLPYVAIGNGNQIVRTTADSTLPGNGVCSISGLHTDSVHLKFSWTPPPGSRGLYNVFISDKDSNCLMPYNHYLQVYTWSFYIDTCNAPMGVADIENDKTIILYPNPAIQKLTIESNEAFSNVKIYNLLSELMIEKELKPSMKFELSIGHLPSGIYIVNIDGKYIRKLVIEK